jgi:alpha-tubulin suppressor-like RCC1 family protein
MRPADAPSAPHPRASSRSPIPIHHMLRMHLFALLAALLAYSPAAADAPPSRWATVSVGHDHACALDSEGRAFCWGLKHAGQLGGRTPTRSGIVN